MKKPIVKFSEEELDAAYGELSAEERHAILSGLDDRVEGDPAVEANLHRGLTSLGRQVTESSTTPVPPIPEAVKRSLRDQMVQATAERKAEEAALAVWMVKPEVNRKKHKPEGPSGWAGLFRAGPIMGLAGVAAAVMIGMFFLGKSGLLGNRNVPVAQTAKILTPGKVTGFRAPVFTWTSDNGGAVNLEVVDAASGVVVAQSEQVFSPIGYENFSKAVPLDPAKEYRFRILTSGKSLAEVSFQVGGNAISEAPVPEATLEGVIQQCQQYIASGRPADAWMLWSKLTSDETGDTRMQELKKLILDLIG